MMSNDRKGREKLLVLVALVIAIVLKIGFGIDIESIFQEEVFETETQSTQASTENPNNETTEPLIVTMIDVGQADSFLFEQNGMTALIDCGTRSTGKNVVKYLQEQGITKLDYVIGTHPHDDHMGGMYDVITNFEIGTIIIPEVTINNITSVWYLKLMNEISENDYNVVYPKVGDTYTVGGTNIRIIGPYKEPESNINNYSIVMMVTYGTQDILMTGDAETTVERDILEAGENIDVEILKLGHHGSDTSTSEEFLDAASPEYALVSCGLGNKYKHPIESTMEKLEERNIDIYRTDESGTVVVTITTNSIAFDTDPDDYLSGPELEKKMRSK